MNRRILLVLLVAFALAAGAPLATASHGKNDPPAGSCSVSGSVVSAVGLPTDQLINFMASDSSGSWGWVLGFTSDGTWSLTVPPPNGAATYQFVSKTWGPNGSKYTVFASCSG